MLKRCLLVILVISSLFYISGCKVEDKYVVLYLEKEQQLTAPCDGYFIDKNLMLDMGLTIGQEQ